MGLRALIDGLGNVLFGGFVAFPITVLSLGMAFFVLPHHGDITGMDKEDLGFRAWIIPCFTCSLSSFLLHSIDWNHRQVRLPYILFGAGKIQRDKQGKVFAHHVLASSHLQSTRASGSHHPTPGGSSSITVNGERRPIEETPSENACRRRKHTPMRSARPSGSP